MVQKVATLAALLLMSCHLLVHLPRSKLTHDVARLCRQLRKHRCAGQAIIVEEIEDVLQSKSGMRNCRNVRYKSKLLRRLSPLGTAGVPKLECGISDCPSILHLVSPVLHYIRRIPTCRQRGLPADLYGVCLRSSGP